VAETREVPLPPPDRGPPWDLLARLPLQDPRDHFHQANPLHPDYRPSLVDRLILAGLWTPEGPEPPPDPAPPEVPESR
jgi:hypothetical protein